MPSMLLPDSIEHICQQAQRLAFALNNHGAMLSSRNQHVKAHECFRDAVHALQISSALQEHHHSACDGQNTLLELTARFNERTSYLITHNDKKQYILDDPLDRESSLQVISSQTNISSLLSLLIESRNTQDPKFLPMMIQSQEKASCNGHGNQKDASTSIFVVSCILLRNLALSKVCLAHFTSEPCQKESLFGKAYHLLKLSRQLLDRVHEEETSAELGETLLLMELLLEHDSLYTSAQLDLELEAMYHNDQFQIISTWIFQREQLINNGLITAAAA